MRRATRSLERDILVRMHKPSSRHIVRGFTIIELLVVIAIIGIISALILTGVTSSRAKGREAAALQTMKGLYDVALLCVSTNVSSYTFCLPGQTTSGCQATAINDTNNGGGGFLCSSNPNARYTSLPSGWVYCDGTPTSQSATNCGNDVSSLPSGSFRIRAESNLDGKLITCVETGCTVANDGN